MARSFDGRHSFPHPSVPPPAVGSERGRASKAVQPFEFVVHLRIDVERVPAVGAGERAQVDKWRKPVALRPPAPCWISGDALPLNIVRVETFGRAEVRDQRYDRDKEHDLLNRVGAHRFELPDFLCKTVVTAGAEEVHVEQFLITRYRPRDVEATGAIGAPNHECASLALEQPAVYRAGEPGATELLG